MRYHTMNQRCKITLNGVLLLILLHLSGPLSAASPSTAPATPSPSAHNPQQPVALLEHAVAEIVAGVSVAKTKPEAEREAYFRTLVATTIGPLVDFELIAKRVIGAYNRYLSDQQRHAFGQVFRASLIDTYANGIGSYSGQKIVTRPFAGIKTIKGKQKAVIDMELHTDAGTVYPVSYAMYLDPQQQWKLENLYVNGVNIGLTFRNQFSEAMRANAGNFEQVLNRWRSDVGAVE